MAYVPVPKDLTKVKTKVAFNLTKRQLVCFGGWGAHRRAAFLFAQGACWNQYGDYVYGSGYAALFSACHV